MRRNKRNRKEVSFEEDQNDYSSSSPKDGETLSISTLARSFSEILTIVKLLLLLLTTHRSTKPPEANTATHAPPPPQSIQSLYFEKNVNFLRFTPFDG